MPTIALYARVSTSDQHAEHDRRNAFARIVREIEALDSGNRPPVLVAAYEELLRFLQEG